MGSPLYQLVYCSRNTLDDGRTDADEEIRVILGQARRNNARDGITGALVYSAGSFAQVLEGPLPTLERTFERIQCDPRHGNVIVLSLQAIKQPDFADWSMAYAGKLSDPAATQALSTAFDGAEEDGAKAVLGMLRGLIHREEDWAATA